jgi:Tfp pilus assembly protein PilX
MKSCQRGAALVTAMVLVVIVLMIGVSGARAAFSAEKSARLERDRLVALGAAEAVLGDAMRDIEAGTRSALFDGSTTAFADSCGSGGSSHGLCTAAPAHEPAAWQAADIEAAEVSAAFGEFTGQRIATAAPGQPYRAPRYVIEPLPAHAGAALYRITAIGFGTRAGTRVVLQAAYHKAGASPPSGHGPVPPPAGRIGWREIANWPELHAAAIK